MPSKLDPRRLSPGATIWCSEDKAGNLADLVIDPVSGELTHLVVEPEAKFRQLRLVPMWMVAPSEKGPLVSLDVAHFRQLQRVLETDFIRKDNPVVSESGEWNIRFSTCLSLPYFDVPAAVGQDDETVPIAECAIRRGTVVMSKQGDILGAVNGFVVREDCVHALIVSTTMPGGRRRDVVVPLSVIQGEPGDFVMVPLDAAGLRRLPETTVARHTPDPRRFAHSVHDKAWRTGARIVDRARDAVNQIRSR